MDQPQARARGQLAQAHQLFSKGEFGQSRKVLQELKNSHLSIELNKLLCELKEQPGRCPQIMRKMMQILVHVNVKIYKERPVKGKKRTPRISHEFYFWNIIVLAQLLPNPQVTHLVANQALHYLDGLRTSTSLMVLYQMLKTMQSSGRLASCISLIEQQNRLISRVKKLSQEEESYRFLNQILFCKVLLKLDMIDGGRLMYMMKFNQNADEAPDNGLTAINGVPIQIHQPLLHAQIEYQAGNYSHALKILSQLFPKLQALPQKKQLLKAIIEHNIGLILNKQGQNNSSYLFLHRTITSLCSMKQNHTELTHLVANCRDNLLISTIKMLEHQDSNQSSYDNAFDALKNHHHAYSYKINYRKAQLCLNYYHHLLKNPTKVLAYQQIHDFYETVYYYPNAPYFQQKGKNKNPNYTNNKFHYRRYILAECQHAMKSSDNGSEKETKRQAASKEPEPRKEPSREKRGDKSKKKGKKQEEAPLFEKEEINAVREPQNRLKQILTLCEWYLKEALVILEKEKSIIVNLDEEEKGLTQQVNEKLYSEYVLYKGSILSALCYVSLCRYEWSQTLHYCGLYQAFEKQYQAGSRTPAQQQSYYNILTYQLEAYCNLDRIDKAYQLLHQLLSCIDYNYSQPLMCCQSNVQQEGETNFEQMTQYNNFAYNLSVLHSRDNKIPEAYNSIQKLLQQIRQIPSNPKANLPLSIIELLTHYNLRTHNNPSALQLLKRRRILNLPGVIGHYHPTLNITK